MNKTLVFGALVIIVGIGAYLGLRIDSRAESPEGAAATYSQPELGIVFDYRAGPTGYVVEESTPSDTAAQLVRAIVLVRAEDAQQQPRLGGEGPPTIGVHVFKNTKKLSSAMWADAYPQYSNINLKMGDVTEAVVGGANAIRYMADGLYASENVVVAHGDYVYVVSGSYLDAESNLRRDFAPLVASIRFIPAPGQE